MKGWCVTNVGYAGWTAATDARWAASYPNVCSIKFHSKHSTVSCTTVFNMKFNGTDVINKLTGRTPDKSVKLESLQVSLQLLKSSLFISRSIKPV